MVYRVIRQGLIDMEAMFRLIDTPSEIADAPDAWPLVVNGGAVAFENVVFGYEPDRTILNGVSFAVGAGETLAIVGRSEERRVGNACVSTGRSRWSPDH